ncbi:aryl-sulfate sulfotransferase [Methylopila musalis]|uniref:Aryl-sulfate sulfotransferase n=1 Tax=Methylopila musalis TaxID=1134781 RepID=A0ABW3Z2W5_9HYPH
MSASNSVDQNTVRRRGVGLRALNADKASPGFTLFAPITGAGQVYLIDLNGEIVHQWNLPHPPGSYGYLLPNGNLFYNGKTTENLDNVPWWFKGGVVLEAAPSGEIVWEHRHPDHHHDGRRLANGNTVILATERVPADLAARVQGGLPGTELADGGILADVIHEVTPAGEIVWSWHAYEHLDPAVDIITAHDKREEWSHANTVGELANGDFILSFRNLSTVVIVSRATGEIVWKLGREALSHQHYPHELENGNILVFDNGTYRENVALNFSRVVEFDRATKEVVWQYTDTPPQNFFSPYISGAQRLPNGNTLITEGNYGRIFEVTPDREIVWEFVNPHFGTQQITSDASPAVAGEQNSVFRAFRYAPEQIPWLKV